MTACAQPPGPSTPAAPETDLDLARRAGRQDPAAFTTLITRHRQRLHAVCRRITCHEEDAQEALQNTMIIAWRSLAEFDERASVGTWLYRIATNAAIDEVRRRRRRPPPAAETPDLPSPSSVEGRSVARIDIDRALALLPPQYRAVVVLREIADLTYREIADLRGIPVDTVKSQLSRGRQALAKLLSDGDAGPAAP